MMQFDLFTVPELKQMAKDEGMRVTTRDGKPKRKKQLVRELKRRYQTGTSNLEADKARKAKPPGKRVSKNGNVYYEYRKNRSDVPPGLTENEQIALLADINKYLIELNAKISKLAFVIKTQNV